MGSAAIIFRHQWEEYRKHEAHGFPTCQVFLFSTSNGTVAQIAYKQNMNMPSIPEVHSASSEIHIAPHMQASECVQVQSCGFNFKNKNKNWIQYMPP